MEIAIMGAGLSGLAAPLPLKNTEWHLQFLKNGGE